MDNRYSKVNTGIWYSILFNTWWSIIFELSVVDTPSSVYDIRYRIYNNTMNQYAYSTVGTRCLFFNFGIRNRKLISIQSRAKINIMYTGMILRRKLNKDGPTYVSYGIRSTYLHQKWAPCMGNQYRQEGRHEMKSRPEKIPMARWSCPRHSWKIDQVIDRVPL